MAEITGKLATQALNKAVEKSEQNTVSPSKGGDSPFKTMLENAQSDFDFVELLGAGNNKILPSGNVEALSGENISIDPEAFAKPTGPDAGQKVVDMLADFNQQQSQMDLLVNQILHGDKKFSNQELLAIQAHVFHMAQMTELTVKSVELGVSSFRGIMQTQVQ